MVTHDPRGASYADRVVFLADGNIVDELRRSDAGLGARAHPDAGRPDMWRVTIKGLLAHKLRLALTALAIVLGVTFIAGTFVLTDTLHNTFDTLFGNIYQNIDFQVRGVAQFGSGGTATRNPVPESLLSTVRGRPRRGGRRGLGHRVRAVHRARRQGHLDRGRAHPRPLLRPQPADLRAPADPGHADRRRPTTSSWTSARRRSTASRSASGCGSCWRARRRTFTITGLARFGTADNLAGATLAAFDTPDGPGAAGRGGQVRRHQRRRPTRRRQGDGPARHRARPAARRRGGDRPDRGQRGDERHRPGAGLPQHGPARLRLHRALRRRLHHPQHVLHHRGPAHAGAGPAAHRRGEPAPGLPLRARRGGRSWAWCRR